MKIEWFQQMKKYEGEIKSWGKFSQKFIFKRRPDVLTVVVTLTCMNNGEAKPFIVSRNNPLVAGWWQHFPTQGFFLNMYIPNNNKNSVDEAKIKMKGRRRRPPFIPTTRPYFISVFCHSWFSRTKPSHMMMMLHNSLPRHPYQPPNLTTPGRIINSFFFSSVYVEKSDKFSFFLISMYYPSKRYEFNTEIVILKVDLCIILLKEKRWQINFFFH